MPFTHPLDNTYGTNAMLPPPSPFQTSTGEPENKPPPLIDLNQSHAFYESVFYNPKNECSEPTEFRLIRHHQNDAVRLTGEPTSHYGTVTTLARQGYLILNACQDGEKHKPERFMRQNLPKLLQTYEKQGITEIVVAKPDVIGFWGTLEEVETDLVRHNADGYSVYVVVNRVKRRALEKRVYTSDADISKVRAVFVDLDALREAGLLAEHKKWRLDPTLTNLGKLQNSPLAPSLIVQTSLEHNHGYWLVTGLKLHEFKQVQWELAQLFGGDTRLGNLSRIMRLPGFANTKGTPVLTRLLEGNGDVYDRGCFIKAFEIALHSRRSPTKSDAPTKGFPPKQPRRKAHVPGGDIPDVVVKALQNHTTADAYKTALVQVWPIVPSFRHSLAVRAASDLYRHGCDQKAAEQAIRAACKRAGDEEVRDRLEAARTTYSRIMRGEPVAGLAGQGPTKTNYPAPVWGKDLRTLAPKERGAEAQRRVLAALGTSRTEPDGSRKTTVRQLAEQTGISKTAASEALRRMSAAGDIRTLYDPGTRTTRVWGKRERIVCVQDRFNPPSLLLAKSAKERDRLERMRSAHAGQRHAYRSLNPSKLSPPSPVSTSKAG